MSKWNWLQMLTLIKGNVVQECVYHILPGQWLRKTFPGLIFAYGNILEKRYRLCIAEYKIFELPDDSQKIVKQNMVDRFIDRPNVTSSSGKFIVLDAFFLKNFHDTIIYHPIQNIRKMITNQKNSMMTWWRYFKFRLFIFQGY